MNVRLQGCFSCNYFTEDLSGYAPEPADDIFFDRGELRSKDAETNKNLGSAPENWDSNEDSAPRLQQQKRARVTSPVARVNADATNKFYAKSWMSLRWCKASSVAVEALLRLTLQFVQIELTGP